MEQAGEDLANSIVDGFMAPITKLSDFCKSLPHRIKGWIGSINLREFLPSFWGVKQPFSPYHNLRGRGVQIPLSQKQKAKSAPPSHTIKMSRCMSMAPVILLSLVVRLAHAIQRARANALHGGTE
ncbi:MULTISPECIES: hypothetical protein [unclassified Bartonella]|uniref:hypothetical protein n=1 Tax=unclassified Bartonella TaxID=2645622 RepID=UPI0035D0AE41